MFSDVNFLLQSMAWPLVLLLAWFVGERLPCRACRFWPTWRCR